MRQEESKTIRAAIWAAVLFLMVQVFHTSLNTLTAGDSFFALYLILGCCSAAFGFAIFAQGRLLFSNRLSAGRLYLSALFLGICLFDFLHTLSFAGIPFVNRFISPGESLWLLALSRMTSALGILLIFSRADRPVSAEDKNRVFRICTALILLFLTAFAWGRLLFPELLNEGLGNWLKRLVDLAVLFLYLAAILVIVYPGSGQKSASMLIIIRTLIFMALGQAFLMNTSQTDDFNYLIGMGCSAVAS